MAKRRSSPGGLRRRTALAANSVALAIEATHGVRSMLLRRERVVERFRGRKVWEGEVLVFALEGHPRARRCYAWEVDGKLTLVLGVPPVDSAQAAVRASIGAD
jgi:hypothetical protein